jgi:translation initiation factor IF-3
MMILLIGEDGKKIGNVTFKEGKRLAKEASKDLVIVNAEKKVYRIIDEGKLRYEQKQRKKLIKAQQRTHKIKEIKFGLMTDAHDINIKSERIREFLAKGYKTKITMQFKGRQVAFKEAGLQKLYNVVNRLIEEGVALLDKEPSFAGRNLTAILTPPKTQEN